MHGIPPETALWHKLALTEKMIKLEMKRQLADLDISIAEAMTLIALARNGHESGILTDETLRDHVRRMSQDQLVADLHYDKGFMTRTMKTLMEAKLVERSPNPEDARSVMYSLTAQGAALVPELSSRVRVFDEALVAGLTNQEIESFMETLSKLADNAKNQ